MHATGRPICAPSTPCIQLIATFDATVVVAGSGEFLAHVAALKMPWSAAPAILSLRNQLGEAVSTAACAYAVAVLSAERCP